MERAEPNPAVGQAPPLAGVLLWSAGVAILAVAAARLDIGVSEAARAVLVLGVMTLPAGYLLTRKLAPGLLSPGDRLILVAVVGYPAGAAALYLAALVGFEPLVPAVALGLALAAILVAARARRPSSLGEWTRRTVVDLAARGAIVPVLAAAVLVTTRDNRAFVATEAGLVYPHSTDHLAQLSFYWELVRGVPPEQLPLAAGTPFPRYHLLAYLPGVALARYGGIGVTTVYHAVGPLHHLLLLFGAVYGAVRIRTGDRRTAAASVLAMCFVSGALELLFRDRLVWGTPPFYFFLRSVSGAGGMVLWAGVAYLLAIHQRLAGSRRDGVAAPLYLASLLAGASFAVKAQAFLLFGGAFGLALILFLLRDRSRTHLIALGIFVVTAAALFVSWNPAAGSNRLQIEMGRFARNLMYPALRRDSWPFLHDTLWSFFQAVPGGLGWVLATPLGLWRLLGCSLFVPAFVLRQVRQYRTVGLADAVIALVVVVALPFAYGLNATEAYGEVSPLVFREPAHALPLLAIVVDIAVVATILGRRVREPGRWTLLGTLVLAAGLTPTLFRRRESPDHTVIPRNEECALLFLRDRTPPAAVVATLRPDPRSVTSPAWNRYALVGGLAGRRSVLEYFDAAVDPRADREKDLRRLFATDHEEVARGILRRYGVTHVLEYPSRPLNGARSALRTVLDLDGVRVWEVSDAPPRSPAAEFRCSGALR